MRARSHGRSGLHARALALCALALLAAQTAGSARAQSDLARDPSLEARHASPRALRAEGPDGLLYVLRQSEPSGPNGRLEVRAIARRSADDPNAGEVGASGELLFSWAWPPGRDDGRPRAGARRETRGIAVAGTASNPVIYSHAVSRRAPPGGSAPAERTDAASGAITRIRWVGDDLDDPNGYWDAVDLVRGLPATRERPVTTTLELLRVGGDDHLIVFIDERGDAGSGSAARDRPGGPVRSASVLSVNLSELEAMPVGHDATGDYVYVVPPGDDRRPLGDASSSAISGDGVTAGMVGALRDPDPSDTGDAGGAGDPAAAMAGWIDLDEDESYTGRHECSFVQAGDRWYLFGGREQAQKLDTYDFDSDTWSVSASPPVEFNHFQATEYQGLVWVIGAFETNGFPNEDPADQVAVYDPANDVWMQGPDVPVSRRRGGAGLVVYDDRFYVVGGNTIGHNGGYVPWLDEFDPVTGTWTALADAPHARDHFHAIVVGDALYALGGRLSGGPGGTFEPLVPEVDVFDFTTMTWSTLPAASNIPTPRAASGVAWFDGLVMVMGGEDGSQAWNIVEGFDPTTGLWQSLPPMNYTRHGTQAIVSGQGVYILAGSPNKGGGNQKNMEVYGADAPAGTASVAGQLAAPAQAFVTTAGTATISFDHVAGNTGVYVTEIALSGPDSPSFSLASPPSQRRLIPVGGALEVGVDYGGGALQADATLEVTHGDGQVTQVQLVPEPGALAGAIAGLTSLLALRRRRMRTGRLGVR